MTLFDQPVKERNAVVQDLQRRMTEGIGDGWTDVLKNADDILYSICDQLIRSHNSTICPSSNEVFQAFRECKFSKLRVVFVLQDPYHQVVDYHDEKGINQMRVADGLAMSCSHTNKLQPSLKLVYDEIERTVGHTDKRTDLRCWANQGVLLMNTALTVGRGVPGSHAEVWRGFTQYLLSELSKRLPKMIYVFFGSSAKSFSTFVSAGTKYHLVHPAAAAYRGGQWNSDDVFNNINYLLQSRKQDKIVW